MTGTDTAKRQFAFRLFPAALLWLWWLAAAAAPTDAVQPAYRLEALAQGLQQAPGTARADLAGIALDELSAEYAREAFQARAEVRASAAPRELGRWADAVERLATQLAMLAASVTAATPVHISISSEHSLYLVVNGEPVVVNGPRTAGQAALETRIIERFCNLNPCAQWLQEAARSPAPSPVPAANPHWSFGSDAGPVCSSGDGLDFAFRDSENLLQKRDRCARAIGELYVLADALTRQASSGLRIEWDVLAIHPASDEDAHDIELNSDGATVRLRLPLLAGTPWLLSRARAWLVARIDGRQQRVVIENADQLLAAGDTR